ncbi:hypothetical protein FRC17_001272 [Serendipita sp. 399]|nr:hypothetical protein FRC17_001272 [Serendipita sp. 399]
MCNHVVHNVIVLSGGGTWDDDVIDVILWMWDYELWRPLPDDIAWREQLRNGEWRICRMKWCQAKPGYEDGCVWLEVDENGDVLDTPENHQLKEWIQEEPIKEPKSRLSKFLKKLNV